MCQHECCPDSGPFQLCCLRVSKLGWVSRFSACEKVLNHVSGAQVFFALALRPGGMRAPQIGGFCGSVAFWTPLYWWWMAFWGKILCMPRLLAKTPQKAILLQKPPIWGDLFLESHYGHNILQRKKALAIEALRVENVIMRTKLLKWSSFSPNFTQKVSFSPLPRT